MVLKIRQWNINDILTRKITNMQTVCQQLTEQDAARQW